MVFNTRQTERKIDREKRHRGTERQRVKMNHLNATKRYKRKTVEVFKVQIEEPIVERQAERDRERDRDRQTDRQTDRDRETDRETK